MDEKDLEETTVLHVEGEPSHHRKKKRKKKRRKLSKGGRVFFTVLLIAALCWSGWSGYNLYLGIREYRQSTSAYKSLASQAAAQPSSKPQASAEGSAEPSLSVDFNYLLSVNSDTAGWLYLPDSQINYPIVHGSDNSYYLEHLFDGTVNHTGTIFMDYRNHSDFSDRNTVLYAHHMRNGSMFADIEKYRDQSWYDSHREFRLETVDGSVYKILPFAGILATGSDDYVQIEFADHEDFASYVMKMKASSTFTTDVEVSDTDQIVTFSTCRYDVDDGRYALFGKLVKEQ